MAIKHYTHHEAAELNACLFVTLHDYEQASERLEQGQRLSRDLRRSCREAGSPAVPAPVADAIRAICEWADDHDAQQDEIAWESGRWDA